MGEIIQVVPVLSQGPVNRGRRVKFRLAESGVTLGTASLGKQEVSRS